jgi:general secretion pathway protein C
MTDSMSARRTPILVHLLGAAAASALLAYWVLKLIDAPTAPPPPPPAQVGLREPDAGLAGRMFGDVGAGAPASALNVQVSGVFAAGRASSAVVSVDGKPQRAVLLGQELSQGVRLAEVRPDGVTLVQGGTRTQISVPAPTIARSTAPVAAYRREGATLTAPSVEAADAGRNALPGQAAAAAAAAGGPLAPGFQTAGVPGRVAPETLLPRRNPGALQADRPPGPAGEH